MIISSACAARYLLCVTTMSEARVKKCLEALEQVNEAVVSHEKGTALVKLNAELSDEVLKKTVEEQDYEVTGIS